MRNERTAVMAALAAGCLAIWAAPCAGQRGDLREKLKDLNVRRTTAHYALAGTITDTRMNIYADALEYIYKEYRKGFVEVLKDRGETDDKPKKKRRGRSRRGRKQAAEEARTMDQLDEHGRFPVIIFNNKRQYEEFGRAFLGGSEHTIGMYIPSCRLLVIMDQGNFNETTEVLFHEAFHQFMHRYVNNPPIWLNEGLAVHYGYARPTPNGLVFRNPPAFRWEFVRELIRSRRATPLWDIVNADYATFYDKTPIDVSGFINVTRSSVYYSEAYTLVHTLLSDRSGRERLRDYLRALARDDGFGADMITREFFGPKTCEHMASFWAAHINSRPETR